MTDTIYETPADCHEVSDEELLDLVMFLEYADIQYCEKCGWSVNVRNVGNHHFCRHCIENMIHTGELVVCNVCGEVMLKSEAVTFDSGNDIYIFCQSCADDRIVECSDCGRKFIRDYEYRVYNRDNEWRNVCPDCIGNYNQCMDCSHHVDYELNQGLCAVCENAFIWTGESYRYDYHDWEGEWNFYNNDGSVTKFPADRDTIYLGAELEMNGDVYEEDMEDCLSDMNNCLGGLVHYERDGSLDDNGIEIISMPMTISQWRKKIDSFDNAFSCAANYDYYCNRGTGLHVHVSCTMFENKHHKRLLFLLDRFRQEIINLSRRTTSYAEYRSIAACMGKLNEPDFELSGYYLGKYFDWIRRRSSHYIYINYGGYPTQIEFRMFEGTMDKDDFLGTIELVQRCMEIPLEYSLQKLRTATFDELFKGKYPELDILIWRYINDRVEMLK